MDVAGKGAASWVRFRGKQAALVPQVGGPLNSVVDVFSGVHPLPRTTDGMASPGLLQDVQVRSLVVKDPACCVLQPKKKKRRQKLLRPPSTPFIMCGSLEKNEPLPLTPALEQVLRDLLRKRG